MNPGPVDVGITQVETPHVETIDVRPVAPDDTQLVDGLAGLCVAVDAVDAPWRPSPTPGWLRGLLRHGWDGDVPRWYVALEAGQVVASGGLFASTYDNLEHAWFDLQVHPDHRRRGIGTAMLDELERQSLADGRPICGVEGWESPATRAFATARGYELKQIEVCRRLTVADLPSHRRDALRADAAARAAEYELLRIAGASPEELLPQLVRVTEAINDAPLDDIVREDDVFSVDRVRAYETAQRGRGQRLYRVVARHRPTGALAGHTVVSVDAERPSIGDQHDTSVARGHRGHRLGLLLKTDMMAWLAEAEPALQTVDTYNAESNHHMISVNEAMGYRVMARALAYQRTLRPD